MGYGCIAANGDWYQQSTCYIDCTSFFCSYAAFHSKTGQDVDKKFTIQSRDTALQLSGSSPRFSCWPIGAGFLALPALERCVQTTHGNGSREPLHVLSVPRPDHRRDTACREDVTVGPCSCLRHEQQCSQPASEPPRKRYKLNAPQNDIDLWPGIHGNRWHAAGSTNAVTECARRILHYALSLYKFIS